MPRKKQEEEEQIEEVKKQPVQATFADKWFDSHVDPKYRRDLEIVCDCAATEMARQFNMSSKSGNTKIWALAFHGIYITILEFLSKMRNSYNQFSIEIAHSINIGYTNDVSAENEIYGNFTPIIEFIGTNRAVVTSSSVDTNATQRNLMRWIELNCDLNDKSTAKYRSEIENLAMQRLQQDYKMLLQHDAAVFPVFGTFMDTITKYMKKRFEEADGTGVSRVEMDVFHLFTVRYSYSDELGECIDFKPGIGEKLDTKDNSIASRGM